MRYTLLSFLFYLDFEGFSNRTIELGKIEEKKWRKSVMQGSVQLTKI